MQAAQMIATDMECLRGNFNEVTVRGTVYADDGEFKGTVYADSIDGDVPNSFVFTNTETSLDSNWKKINRFTFTKTRERERFIYFTSPEHSYIGATDFRLLWDDVQVAYIRTSTSHTSFTFSVFQSWGNTGVLELQAKTFSSGVTKQFPEISGWLILVGYNTGSIVLN
jgi:hypothetical protein